MISQNHKGETEMRVGDELTSKSGETRRVVVIGISGFKHTGRSSKDIEFCAWANMREEFPRQAKLVLHKREARR